MRPVIPYLLFPGTCETALRWYAEVLGAEVVRMTTVADAPAAFAAPDTTAIFDAEIRAGDLVIKGSDDPTATTVGAPALFVTLDDRAAMERVLARLADGGAVLFPSDGSFGMVADRYGVRWMLTHAAA